jgi:hypothetical protein
MCVRVVSEKVGSGEYSLLCWLILDSDVSMTRCPAVKLEAEQVEKIEATEKV